MVDSKQENALIVRSTVQPVDSYLEYKKTIRYDFWYSCAYCTITESEAHAVYFTIDHYEPQTAKPNLRNVYSNLMYCCGTCNERKSDRCPPAEAREAGYRFFRPDQDDFQEHFDQSGWLLNGKTNTGNYTIQAVDLNRGALRRLRELRSRATKCLEDIDAGIHSLVSAKIDRLPANIRGYAHTLRSRLIESTKLLEGNIESFLRDQAASPFVDSEDDKRHKKERAAYLENVKAIYPDAWSGRQIKATRASSR